MGRIIRHPDGPKKGWVRCYTCERMITPSESRLALLGQTQEGPVELELCNLCDDVLRRFGEAMQKASKGEL